MNNNHPEWKPGERIQCWVSDPSQRLTGVGAYPGVIVYRRRAVKNGLELFVVVLRSEGDFAIFGIGTIQPKQVCPSELLYVNRVIEIKEKGSRAQLAGIRRIAYGD